MKKTLFLIPLVVLVGCAHLTTTQTHETYGDKGQLLTKDTTHGSAETLFDSSNTLTKWTAHQSETNGQYNTVGGLDQSASGTNTVAALQAIGVILQNLPK